MPTLLTTLLVLLTGVLMARVSAGRLVAWAVPAIVLELAVGFLLGNTVLPFEAIRPLSGITELGVLTLFFQVGLEVRGDVLSSRRNAVLRTVALSFLAPLLAYLPLSQAFGLARSETLLCLAVLSATGTGVTLRVLALGKGLQTPSGRLLVGVSVLDDLPAIALLSVAMASAGVPMGGAGLAGLGPVLGLVAAAVSYLAVGVWARRRPERPTTPLSILLVLIGFSWLGEVSGLTSLLGALWGGLLLARLSPPEAEMNRTLAVLSDVFLPLYFISVGMRIPAATLLDPQAWSLAAALVVMAVLTKLLCGLGVTAADRAAGVDRWLVVFGLIPRGLPGLVFATTALSAGVINASQFSALVIMVTLTTVLGLLLLERRLAFVRKAAENPS
jgi:Kef-type K+ transport system membrane component KefB